MDKLNFQNGVTKVNAETFNTFQNNIDNAINTVDTKATTIDKKTLPIGGTTGQILIKKSNTNYDVQWQNKPEQQFPKIIKNDTLSSATANITFLSSFEEGIYQFILEGNLPPNTSLYFDGLTDATKFSFSCTNTYVSATNTSPTIKTQQWYDNEASTFIPIVGYNNLKQYQNAIGIIEVRGNILTYQASSLAKGDNKKWSQNNIIGRVVLTSLNTVCRIKGATSDKFASGTKLRIYKIAD